MYIADRQVQILLRGSEKQNMFMEQTYERQSNKNRQTRRKETAEERNVCRDYRLSAQLRYDGQI